MVVPDDTAVSKPVAGLIVATVGLELVHVPPEVISASVAVVPIHWSVVPMMAATDGEVFTVTVVAVVAVQPPVPVTV